MIISNIAAGLLGLILMKIQASLVAIVTPMQNDGSIDYAAFEQLLDWHQSSGTSGVVVLGTTGESPTLSSQEREQLIRLAVKHSAGRYPVIIGAGSNSTTHTIELTQQAKTLGADAVLLVVPYYNKPTQQGLYEHFKAVAEAVAIPQLLYNVPGRTITDLSDETIARLSQVKNIIGIKEASGDVARVTNLRQTCGDEFVLLSGDDATGVDFVLAGGNGVISVVANVVPKQMSDIFTAALAGEGEKAKQLDEAIAALHKGLFIESNPIPVKWALQQMGKIGSGIRLPLTPLSKDKQTLLNSVLIETGVRSESETIL